MIQSETPHGPKRLGGPYGGHYLSPLVQIGLGNVHKGYPIFWQFLEIPKGQLISKANCQAVDYPKMHKWHLTLLFKSKKANLFVRFFGESTARCFVYDFFLPLVE